MTCSLLLLSISGFINLDQLPLAYSKLLSNSNVLLKFDSLVVISTKSRSIVRYKLKICLLYSFKALLYGLTNLRLRLTTLRLGLVVDSRVEKSYIHLVELDTA